MILINITILKSVLIMTKKEMIQWLEDEVTMSGSLNISLPEKEYERIIDKELLMIYELYPEAIKYDYTIIDVRSFYTPEFRQNRKIQFPDCVLSVVKFEEMKRRNAMFGINDPDFAFNKTFQADMWLGSQMNMDSVMFRTIQWSLWDQLKQFNLVDIKHKWNRSDKTLLIEGHDPHCNVFCEVAVKVPETELYDDPWVRQWLSAKCKLQVAKKIGTFTTTLIGGVTINTGLYTDEANKDLEECKTKWLDMQQADWFCTSY